jgi:hypothetical protein
MDEPSQLEVRMDCLRLAVEFGSARDLKNPHLLADVYYEWVTQGSGETRPEDSRTDDSRMKAKKSRGVRKGSALQSSNVNV